MAIEAPAVARLRREAAFDLVDVLLAVAGQSEGDDRRRSIVLFC